MPRAPEAVPPIVLLLTALSLRAGYVAAYGRERLPRGHLCPHLPLGNQAWWWIKIRVAARRQFLSRCLLEGPEYTPDPDAGLATWCQAESPKGVIDIHIDAVL